MKTIFLAETEKHVREALHLTFTRQSDYVILGEATTSESLLAQVCQHPPDAILLDWTLPGFHPQRLLTALRQCCPETIILVTSVQPELAHVVDKYGVDAFLLKQLPPDEFIDRLNTAMHKCDSRRTKTSQSEM
jgi:DNA-binding NarL/FixJ family response regulator